MKIYIPLCSVVLLCFSCMSKSERMNNEYLKNKKDFQQMVQAQKFKMYTGVFIKPGSLQETNNELIFQTRLIITKDQFEKNKNLSTDLKYRVDSAFILLNKNDTIWPAYVMPVANGQPLNPQFIVSFNSSEIREVLQVKFIAAIKSISTSSDSGIIFNLNRGNSLYKQ